jgi:hypothetical protein
MDGEGDEEVDQWGEEAKRGMAKEDFEREADPGQRTNGGHRKGSFPKVENVTDVSNTVFIAQKSEGRASSLSLGQTQASTQDTMILRTPVGLILR